MIMVSYFISSISLYNYMTSTEREFCSVNVILQLIMHQQKDIKFPIAKERHKAYSWTTQTYLHLQIKDVIFFLSGKK